MARTLSPRLQWRNGRGEKAGHRLHSARSPADSPKQLYCNYYCISFITAISCLFHTSSLESQFQKVFPYDFTESHLSLRTSTYTHTHTCTQEWRSRPQYLHIFFSFSPSEKLFFLSLKRSDKDFTLETDGSCWLLLSCSEVLKVNQKRRFRFTSA